MPIFSRKYSRRVADCAAGYAAFAERLDRTKCDEKRKRVGVECVEGYAREFLEKAMKKRDEHSLGMAERALEVLNTLCADCMKGEDNADI